jgi:hypothetical protein
VAQVIELLPCKHEAPVPQTRTHTHAQVRTSMHMHSRTHAQISPEKIQIQKRTLIQEVYTKIFK